jgi:hypothetical protein
VSFASVLLPPDNPYNQKSHLSVDASYSMVAYGFLWCHQIFHQTLVSWQKPKVSSINLVLFARIL